MITGEHTDDNYVDPFNQLKTAPPEIIDEIHYSLKQYPLAQGLVDIIRRFTDPVSWKYSTSASYLRFLGDQFPSLVDYEEAFQIQARARREDATATIQVEIVTPRSTRRHPSSLYRSSAMGIFFPQGALRPKDMIIRAGDLPGLSSNLAIEQPAQTISYSSYDQTNMKDDFWLAQVRQSIAATSLQLSSERKHQQKEEQLRETLIRNRS